MKFNYRSGQITILILLLGLMGLTVGLSVASRSLSDYKQVTYVDSGTKAFAGAEAGLQYALTQLNQNITNCGSPASLPDIPTETGLKTVTYEICPNSSTSMALFNGVSTDEIVQVDLANVAANTTTADILWSNPDVAVEVIEVDNNDQISRYIYNGSTVNGQNFSSSFAASTGCANTYCNVAAGFSANGRCTSPNGLGGNAVTVRSTGNVHKLLRVKPLTAGSASSTDIAICGRTSDSTAPNLGAVNYMIDVIATTQNDTKKKLRVVKSPAALPAIFDFAIFTRGSINKL